MNWQNTPLNMIEATFECITDARELYKVEHFPESVRHLVAMDFRRHFSGEGPGHSIFLHDGTVPEAINAVLGVEVAKRIARDRGTHYECAIGWQTTLRRIKTAVLEWESDND